MCSLLASRVSLVDGSKEYVEWLNTHSPQVTDWLGNLLRVWLKVHLYAYKLWMANVCLTRV